jgi:hypothetical protein
LIGLDGNGSTDVLGLLTQLDPVSAESVDTGLGKVLRLPVEEGGVGVGGVVGWGTQINDLTSGARVLDLGSEGLSWWESLVNNAWSNQVSVLIGWEDIDLSFLA